MIPTTPTGLAAAGVELTALALVRSLVPDVAASIPFTGLPSSGREALVARTIIQGMATARDHRRRVIAAAGRTAARAVAVQLAATSSGQVVDYLHRQERAVAQQVPGENGREFAAAIRVIAALVVELGLDAPPPGRVDPVPPGVTIAITGVLNETGIAVKTALLAAGSLVRAAGEQGALQALDAQAAGLMPDTS